MSTPPHVKIEVVLALAEQQVLLGVTVPSGTTVGDAIDLSGIADEFPGLAMKSLAIGVWGKVVDRTRPVQEGDRIEIYRPLPVDPRQARRQIAVEGGYMGTQGSDSEKH